MEERNTAEHYRVLAALSRIRVRQAEPEESELHAAVAEALALKIMRHEVRSAGRRVATELFRAADYGVNQIYQALNGEVSLDAVRQWVEWIDKYNR